MAQSVANCYTAVEEGLEVIPVLNKIDLPSAEPERVQQEVEEIIGIDASEALRVSAKTGLGVEDCWSRSLNWCRHLRISPVNPCKRSSSTHGSITIWVLCL